MLQVKASGIRNGRRQGHVYLTQELIRLFLLYEARVHPHSPQLPQHHFYPLLLISFVHTPFPVEELQVDGEWPKDTSSGCTFCIVRVGSFLSGSNNLHGRTRCWR